MTRTILIATVAALAITSPAQSQKPGERGKGGDQAEKQRGGQRAERQERAPRVERQAQRQQRAPHVERQAQRQERAPRVERRAERPERAPRVQRKVERQERAPRIERKVERQERAPRVQRKVERQERAPRVERRVERQERAARVERRVERQQRAPRVEQQAERQQRAPRVDRRMANREQRVDNRAIRQERRADRRQDQRQNMWANLARRSQVVDDRRTERRALTQRAALIGQRIDQDRYDDRFENIVPLGYRTRFYDTPRHYYRYDNDAGYLYQVRRDNNLVSTLFPLLGGAYSIGRPLPYSYSSYNLPLSYSPLYYDTPDYYYRYGSGGIYQVDQGSQLIQAVVALLTGRNFGVGQVLPANYSTYNVPYAYRDHYADSADNWYRYNDGNIYQVDPRTRLIEASYPMSYGGFQVGSLMPYGYDDYNVPYGYQQVYYDTPTYNYRYNDGGIYQVDPTTQIVQSLVALVTGQNYNVGQAMPASYGVYNVPYAYRDQYADTSDSWYRYNDGTIYQLDPGTRVIRDSYNIYV